MLGPVGSFLDHIAESVPTGVNARSRHNSLNIEELRCCRTYCHRSLVAWLHFNRATAVVAHQFRAPPKQTAPEVMHISAGRL